MNDLYNVETVEQGKPRSVTMRGVDIDDAKAHMATLISDMKAKGYVVVDPQDHLTLMRNAAFKTFAILIRKHAEAKAS